MDGTCRDTQGCSTQREKRALSLIQTGRYVWLKRRKREKGQAGQRCIYFFRIAPVAKTSGERRFEDVANLPQCGAHGGLMQRIYMAIKLQNSAVTLRHKLHGSI